MFSKPKHPGCKCGAKYKKYILCCKILMTILFLQSLWAKKKKRLTKKKSNRTVMWNHKVGWKAIRNATGRNRFFIFLSSTNLNMLEVSLISIDEFLPQIQYVHICTLYMYLYYDQFFTDFLNHCLEFQMSKRNCLDYE